MVIILVDMDGEQPVEIENGGLPMPAGVPPEMLEAVRSVVAGTCGAVHRPALTDDAPPVATSAVSEFERECAEVDKEEKEDEDGEFEMRKMITVIHVPAFYLVMRAAVDACLSAPRKTRAKLRRRVDNIDNGRVRCVGCYTINAGENTVVTVRLGPCGPAYDHGDEIAKGDEISDVCGERVRVIMGRIINGARALYFSCREKNRDLCDEIDTLSGCNTQSLQVDVPNCQLFVDNLRLRVGAHVEVARR